jgi:hypothetical protein
MPRALPSLRGTAALAAVLASCTFTDLAVYDTRACDPTRSFDMDECTTALVAPSCQEYTCGRATSRCELGALDFDRDGDPPIACGGKDCDDRDPSNSGIGREVCDGKDNNCNGLIDEDLFADAPSPSGERNLPALVDPSIAQASGGSLILSYVSTANPDAGGGSCVGSEQDPPSVFGGGCLPYGSAPETAPRQPFSLPPEGLAPLTTVYVTGDACDSIGLRDTTGQALELPCDGHVSLPSLGATAKLSSSSYAMFAVYYDAPLASRLSASQCANAAPASLFAQGAPFFVNPNPPPSGRIQLSMQSKGFRAAATLSAWDAVRNEVGPSEIVVAPDGDGVTYWDLVPLDAAPGLTVVATGQVPGLGFATSVAVATQPRLVRSGDADTGRTAMHFAAVAEIGCPPTPTLRLAVGAVAWDGNAWALSVDRVEGVLSLGAPAAWAPAVSWTSTGGYSEWRVTWLTAQGPFMRRFAGPGGTVPEGTAEGGSFALSTTAPTSVVLAAAPAQDGHALTVEQGSAAALGLVRHSIGCSN